MSKELLISLFWSRHGGGSRFGHYFPKPCPQPGFSLIGWLCVAGQIVTAHLAFNQYKNLSTQTPNEGQENDGEERSEDGFDD